MGKALAQRAELAVVIYHSIMVRGLLRTSNLPQLQNLIKRDPVSYKEEFLQQWNHYNSIRQIFQINPADQASHFRELVTFISQVGSLSTYASDLIELVIRLRSSIPLRPRNFRPTCPPCCLKAMDRCLRIFVTASYRTWLCLRIKASSHPLSEENCVYFL
jgi:hypothetical protein